MKEFLLRNNFTQVYFYNVATLIFPTVGTLNIGKIGSRLPKLVLYVVVLFNLATNVVHGQCTTANTSLFPASTIGAGTGQSVTISTCNYEGQYSRVNGIVSASKYIISINNPSSKITVRTGSATGTILGSGIGTATVTATSASDFFIHWNTSSCGALNTCRTTTIAAVAVINSFSPASACPGSTVTINGKNFTSASAVKFGGVSATSFTVVSSSQITALVPVGAVTGVISVTNGAGTFSSTGNFTLLNCSPVLSSFSPASGCPSVTTVTLTGSNFTGATSVKFNGVSATSYTVVSSSSINAIVPATATSGLVSVTTTLGTATGVATFSVNPPTSCYCTPVFSTGCSFSDLITNFTLNTLSNNSGTACSTIAPLGYTVYGTSPSNLTTTLNQAITYTAQVTIGSGGSAGVAMWIDYNNNGIFETTENYNSGSTQIPVSGTASIALVVPASASVGAHRLRVRLVYNLAGASIDPCASYTYGEAEDYTITVAATSACSGSPVAGSVSANVTDANCPASAVLTLSGQTFATGLGYQWQSQVNGGTWNNISGANATTLSQTGITSNTMFRCQVSCLSSGLSSISSAASVNVNPTVNFVSSAVSPNGMCSPSSSQLTANAVSGTSYVTSSTPYALLNPVGSSTAIYTANGTTTTYDDDISPGIALPFAFNFYGQLVDTIYVSTNGYVVMDGVIPASSIYNTVALPSTGVPNGFIAGVWDDLNVYGTGSAISYFLNGSSPNRIFVINYSNLRFYNGGLNGGNVSFQIRLVENGNKIEVHVADATDPDLSVKVSGIENAAGITAITPPGKNNTIWSVAPASPEAWVFSPSSLSYTWSPSSWLSSSSVQNPGIVNAVNSITYTVTATELNGCSATATVPFTVVQTPTLTSVASQSVCSGTAVAPINFSVNPSSSVVSWTNNNTQTGLTASGSGNIGSFTAAQVNTDQVSNITVSASNGSCVAVPVSTSISVSSAPVFVSASAVSYNNDPGICGAFVHLSAAVSNSVSSPITYDVTSDTVFYGGATPVTATASNSCGTSSYTYTVIVNDVEQPVLEDGDSVLVTTDVGQCHASLSALPVPSFSDNCGVQTVTSNASGTLTVGIHSITWTAIDFSGNARQINQFVKIKDLELPLISGLSAITINLAAGLCSASGINLGTPVTSDNCGVASVNNNAPATYPIGTTIVVWTVTDIHGNSNTFSQPVHVIGAGNNLPLATPAIINGPAAICPGSYSNVTYTTPAVPGATSYVWFSTWPITILSGQGTNTVTVSFGSGLTTSHLSVAAVNGCGSSLTFTKPISKSAVPGTPGQISGSKVVCGLSTATYSVSPVTYASAYTWTLPVGITLVSGQGSNVITVSFASSFNSGSILVTASNTCGTSAARSLSISKIPAAAGVVSGPTFLCGVNSATYSVSAVVGASGYTWTMPSGISVVNGQGSNIVTVSVSSAFVSGTMTVTAFNNCGTASNRTLAISRVPAKPGSISGPVSACSYAGTQTNASYSVAPVANASSYNWTVPAGATLISGQGTNNISVQYASSFVSGSISVQSVGVCGSSAFAALSITKAVAPAPTAIAGPVNVCGLSSATYSVAASAYATSYTWTLPAGLNMVTGMGTNVISVSIDSSFASGTLSVTRNNACGSSLIKTIALSSCAVRMAGMTSDDSLMNTEITVYPNPSKDIFTVNLHAENEEKVLAEVFSIEGNCLYQEEFYAGEEKFPVINLGHLSNGVYLLRLRSVSGTINKTSKLVLEK